MAGIEQSGITSAQLFGAGLLSGGGDNSTGNYGVLFLLRDTQGINLFAGCAPFGGNINGGLLGIFLNGGSFNPKLMSLLHKFAKRLQEDFAKMNQAGNEYLAQASAAAHSMLGQGVQIGGGDFSGSGLTRLLAHMARLSDNIER